MTGRILIACTAAAAWTVPASGQPAPVRSEPAGQTDASAFARDEDPPDSTDPDRPTAEELLDAMQHHRPVNEPILPVGVDRDSFRIEPKNLLPEGNAVVSQGGYLGRDGQWWTFRFDSGDDASLLRVLPNATLEVMVRTAAGTSSPVRFVISGETTVFDEDNYLLVRVVRRAREAAAPAPPLATPDSGHDALSPQDQPAQPERPGEAPATATATEPADSTGSGATAVEDVLAAMQEQQPGERIIVPPTVAPTPEAPTESVAAMRGGAAARTLLPDGTPLIRRAGRVIRDDPWWTFVFESDQPGHPEPPMKLLPNQSVELMLRATQREDRGIVFLVSGETTLFQGENYLLPHMATARRASGNFTK
jgi:hypothetical protein